MRFLQNASARLLFLFVAIFLASFTVSAQDGEPIVVDEVIAQVNEGVITLSRIKREMKNAVDSLVAEGKTREEAERAMNAKRTEMIASLINEELLLQQGKEIGLEQEVEGEVNQRFEQIRKEQNLKTLEELYSAMRAQGIEPDEIKSAMRKEITKGLVLNREVDSKIYFGLTTAELTKYYEANKEKFRKPESVTLSEIFLSFAGRDESQVKAKAADLVKQLRGGASFEAFVLQHSERPDAKTSKGKLGTVEVKRVESIEPKIAEAIKTVKAGGVTEPVVTDEGVMIFRVDERISNNAAPTFDEVAVRNALTGERSPQERQKYMTNLRTEAFIKISEGYKASVTPVLFKDSGKN
ncbi:MAG TPA: peptidyl-prolyl cis-trans isomerase [Pyrinomonadaceae bacterium]|nr:peptidyl-prolyl cis-trans isomerase [Pyrinomonadaceae bacterium]